MGSRWYSRGRWGGYKVLFESLCSSSSLWLCIAPHFLPVSRPDQATHTPTLKSPHSSNLPPSISNERQMEWLRYSSETTILHKLTSHAHQPAHAASAAAALTLHVHFQRHFTRGRDG